MSHQSANNLIPRRLAIYYAFPSSVNAAAGSVEQAVAVFSDYHLVVLGEGLQDPTHLDHTKTAAIIGGLGVSPNGTKVYGYVPIGLTSLPPGQIALTVAEIEGRIDDWK